MPRMNRVAVGAITLDQLKEYSAPIKEKVLELNNQIIKASSENVGIEKSALPKVTEIELFAQKAVQALKTLKFEAKKAIVRSVIDRVVGTREELQVYGYIPVTNINVFTFNRYRRSSKRR